MSKFVNFSVFHNKTHHFFNIKRSNLFSEYLHTLLLSFFDIEKLAGLQDNQGKIFYFSNYGTDFSTLEGRTLSLILNESNRNNKGIEETQSKIQHIFNVFLDKMLEYNLISKTDFLNLKSQFLENNSVLLSYFLPAIREQDFQQFITISNKFLNQNLIQSNSKTINNKKKITKNDILEIIEQNKNKIVDYGFFLGILTKENILLDQCFNCFINDNDEEELFDSINHIINKKKIESEKEKKEQEQQRKIVERPKKSRENSKREKNNMLEIIFKTFLEETEPDFQNFEIGLLKQLFNDDNQVLIDILNTCETIEKAILLCKDLCREEFSNFLNKNFDQSEIDYILNNINEHSSEICSIFSNFKSNPNLKGLKSVLTQALLVRKGQISACSDSKKYANMLLSRTYQKQSSFKMLLQKEGKNQTVCLNSNENDIPLVVVINQGDNPELKDLLNKFHGENLLHLDKSEKNNILLNEIISKSKNLKENEKEKLEYLFKLNHFGLLKILNEYEKFNHKITKIKNNLRKLLDENIEFVDPPGSPSLKLKLSKFNSFKQIIHEIFDRYQLISKKQLKLFFYLYMEEDIALLGAYEVYLVTNAIQDFVENLRIIDKYHFFKTKLDFDEIEQFDEVVEHQLSLLFAYKKYLNADSRNGLEKSVRAGDLSLLKLFDEFKKKQDKTDFLNKLLKLGEEKSKEIKNLEKIIKENKVNGSEIVKRLETVDTFRLSKFLKNIKYFELINEYIQNNHFLVQSLFEIYEMTKDKAEFIENIELIYVFIYKNKFKEIIKSLEKKLKLKNNQIIFFNDCIDLDIPNILALWELYMVNNDLSELEESLKICLKIYAKEILLLEKKFYNQN